MDEMKTWVEHITITEALYDSLNKQALKLQALEGAGVDNWEGYDDAMDLYREQQNAG